MKSYQSIQAQIQKLQQQASALRARDIKEVVGKIKVAIAEYGFTAADLGLAGKPSKAPRRAAAARGKAKRRTVGAPKYRDPQTGATWTGHGRAPRWIAGATNRDAFLIGSAAASPAESALAPKAARSSRKGSNGRQATPARKPARKAASTKKAAPKARRVTKTPAVTIEGGAATQ